MGQHAGMGDGTGDVVAIQPVVETDRGGECLDEGVGGLGEAAAPGFCGRCFVSHVRTGASICAQYIESAPGLRSVQRWAV